jgi:hypothetical protein
MKKLLLLMVLVMGALVVNAQRTPVKVTDLQKSITDNITKDYVGYTIKEATKVVDKTVTTFEVVITKGSIQETLCYDGTGKFLKKLEAKGGIPKSESKPVTPKKN